MKDVQDSVQIDALMALHNAEEEEELNCIEEERASAQIIRSPRGQAENAEPLLPMWKIVIFALIAVLYSCDAETREVVTKTVRRGFAIVQEMLALPECATQAEQKCEVPMVMLSIPVEIEQPCEATPMLAYVPEPVKEVVVSLSDRRLR